MTDFLVAFLIILILVLLICRPREIEHLCDSSCEGGPGCPVRWDSTQMGGYEMMAEGVMNPVPHRSWTPTYRTHKTTIRYSPTRRDYPFANPDYLADQSKYKCLEDCLKYQDDETRLECLKYCEETAGEVY